MARRNPAVVDTPRLLNTFSATRDAPGATPSTRMAQCPGGEAGRVVRSPALPGDRARVHEGLGAAGRRVPAITGEVLVVGEDAGPRGPPEVAVGGVEAVGQEGDLDARPGVAERPRRADARGRGVGAGEAE